VIKLEHLFELSLLSMVVVPQHDEHKVQKLLATADILVYKIPVYDSLVLF
jgi:hypothetical protein